MGPWSMLSLETKVSDIVLPIETPEPEKQTGRLSTLHLFRRDYIAGQPNRQWISKDGWAEVRAAFSTLSADRKAMYDREKQQNVEKEKHMRESVKKQSDEPILVVQPGGRGARGDTIQTRDDRKQQHLGIEPKVSGLNRSAHVLANLLPSDSEELKDTTTDLQKMSRQTRSYATECNSSGGTNVWPVGETNVLSSLASSRAKGLTLQQATKSFADKCQVIAGPGPDEAPFPRSITIHGKCGALCQLEHSTLERLLHGKITDALQQSVAFDKPTKVVQADVLIAAGIDCGGNRVMKYFFATSVSNKGGYNKPDAVHVMCHVVRANDELATWWEKTKWWLCKWVRSLLDSERWITQTSDDTMSTADKFIYLYKV